MKPPTFEAAYVPDIETRSYDAALDPAIDWVEKRCAEASARAVLVTPVKSVSLYPENLQAFVARHGHHATPKGRYRQRVPRGLPTLAYVPDEQMMEMAGSYGDGAAVCAVACATFPLRGWAAALGAVNLDTGETEPSPSDEAVKVLEHIVFMGNNGYSDSYAKANIGHWIDRLASVAPEMDGAFVGGWVLAKDGSDTGAKRIRALVDGRR